MSAWIWIWWAAYQFFLFDGAVICCIAPFFIILLYLVVRERQYNMKSLLAKFNNILINKNSTSITTDARNK